MVLVNSARKNKNMRNLITVLFLLIGAISFAQSNLTIFNNGGQQFYVILNGIKQNSKPMTNVVVGGIKNGSYSVKLIFADGKTPDIDKNFFIEEPSDITTRVVFKKGKGKLQLIGMEPTKGTSTQQDVIVYRPDNTAVFSDAVVVTETVTQQTNVNSGTQSQTTNSNVSTTTNTQTINQSTEITDPSNPNGNVGMNININVNDPVNGNQNVNMSVNMNGTGTQTTNSTSQTTQTTTITQSTNVNTTGNQTVSNTQNTSTGNSAVTCKNILGDGDKFVKDLKALTFDDDRVAMIRKDLKDHCLTANQAYKILETLTFEEDRLELAKYLYDRMIDKDKGSSLLPLFTFDSSKEELKNYMNKKK